MGESDINRMEYAGGIVGCAVAFISICCSLTTLYLIRAIGRWNGYIALVWSMTVSQIIYDVCFALVFPNDIIFYSNIFLSTYGGVSVTFWTNVMSGVVVYMVFTRLPIDTLKYFWHFFFICVAIPLAYAVGSDILIAYGYLDPLDFSYNIIRLASIGFNFIAYFLIWRKLAVYSKGGLLPPDHPLIILSSRLKFYPIVQIITRIWPSIYEFKYGNSLAHASYNTTTPSSDAEFIFYTFFLPSAGIGYFLVFLRVQPLAYHHFMSLIKRNRGGQHDDYLTENIAVDPYFTNNDSFASNLSGNRSSAAPSVITALCARSEMDEEQLLNEFQRDVTQSKKSQFGGKTTSADSPISQL